MLEDSAAVLLVSHQVAFLSEPLEAVRALEHFLLRVTLDVRLHIRDLVESFLAVLALESLLLGS